MDWFKSAVTAVVVAILIGYIYKKWKGSRPLPVLTSGFADPRFKKVEQVFRENFESGAETGAGFAVYYKGELVVDLWGGYGNKKALLPWREITMSQAYSSSKGITALLVAKFVELGYLDYKKPVSHYWPEFAQNGKEDITVEMLLSHQAGLIGLDEPIQLSLLKTDYKRYTSILAAQKPFWKPGTAFGYHMLTWGLYVDVLLMKADPKNRTVDQILREEITEPFGIDFFQGTPTSEQYRIRPSVYMQSLWDQKYHLVSKVFWKSIKYRIFSGNGYDHIAERAVADLINDAPFDACMDYKLRLTPMSSFNGYGTARGIAKLYGIISNGGVHENKTLFKESTLDAMEVPLVKGLDLVIGVNNSFGPGLMLIKSPKGNTMFGHPGFGGQMGIADRQNNLGIAYLTNNLAMFDHIGRLYTRLSEALYDSLAEIQTGN